MAPLLTGLSCTFPRGMRRANQARAGVVQFSRVLARQAGKSQREIATKNLSEGTIAHKKNTAVRLCIGFFGAAFGFSMANRNTFESSLPRLKDLNFIPCANAIEFYDEDGNQNEERIKSEGQSKRSAQFNFIADAIESATPAVVYIEVEFS